MIKITSKDYHYYWVNLSTCVITYTLDTITRQPKDPCIYIPNIGPVTISTKTLYDLERKMEPSRSSLPPPGWGLY